MRKPAKLYCRCCGSLCEIEGDHCFYDEKTGKSVKSYWATCPKFVNAKWYERKYEHTHSEWVGGHNPHCARYGGL